MKSVGRSALQNLSSAQKERLVTQLGTNVKCLFADGSVKNSHDILDRTVSAYKEQSEPILTQTIIKGITPRLSYPKNDIVKALENINGPISKKLKIINFFEKADTRFVPELITASKFAESSEAITGISLNSEKAQILVGTIASGNKRPDYTLHLGTKEYLMDHKAGNNANDSFGSIVAVIPLEADTDEVYTVINTPFEFSKLQQDRVGALETLLTKNNIAHLQTTIQNFNNDKSLSKGEKNTLIQNELLFFMTKHPTLDNIKFSFYITTEVHVPQQLPPMFSKRVSTLLEQTPQCLENKQEFHKFLAKVIKIYAEEVNPEILTNIDKSRKFWINAGLKTIIEILFNSI